MSLAQVTFWSTIGGKQEIVQELEVMDQVLERMPLVQEKAL